MYFNFYFDLFSKNELIYLLLYLFVYFLNISLIYIIFSFNLMNSNNMVKIIKNSTLNKYNYYILLLSFSSLIGIPPFSGFISKFFLSYFVFLKHNFFVLIVYYILILFSFFYYLQVLKLVKKTEIKAQDLKKNINKKKWKKFSRIFILNLLVFFCLFFLFFFKDIVLFMSLI